MTLFQSLKKVLDPWPFLLCPFSSPSSVSLVVFWFSYSLMLVVFFNLSEVLFICWFSLQLLHLPSPTSQVPPNLLSLSHLSAVLCPPGLSYFVKDAVDFFLTTLFCFCCMVLNIGLQCYTFSPFITIYTLWLFLPHTKFMADIFLIHQSLLWLSETMLICQIKYRVIFQPYFLLLC